MQVNLIHHNGPKGTPRSTRQKSVEGEIGMTEMLRRQESKDGRWRRRRKVDASLKNRRVEISVVIVDLVKMIRSNRAVELDGRLELGHHVGRQRKKRDENETNATVKDANHPDNVRLSPAGSIDG
jgi:hypothetical protein